MMKLETAQSARLRGDYASAIRILNQLLAADQADLAALVERGRLYAELNDREQAKAHFEQVSFADPSGELGDAARAELLRLLAPPKVLFPPRHSQPSEAKTPPNPWALRLVLVLVLISLLCSIAGIGLTRKNVQQRFIQPTPSEMMKDEG
ncbi:tetratricopeptide repeat protein [Herpetosiphon giganteus]|uniref:tetratricopeptide repeat protein n=1 Tax=Herpetosiphon giganteus TaxID=2029754 RepID=UPI00195DEC41|nr:tetratricopeptide repeat protein [Herpetosiphon giganteus]MBM7844212.1 tetratricopeptide (TPR) repeat protein [Herpetosiphon giganteus]